MYFTGSCMSDQELSGTVVSRLDFCADDLGSIPAGTEFPTGI